MYVNGQTIITIGSIVAALGGLLGVFCKVHKWYLRQEEQNAEISALREQHIRDMDGMNDENRLICFALSACLDGLQQLGANHSVPKVKKQLDEYLNEKAHRKE